MLTGSATAPVVIVSHGVTAWDWIHAAITLGVTVAVSQLVRRGVRRLGRGDAADRVVVRVIERIIMYTVVVVGCVYTLAALRVEIGPLLGALGIGGIALAFAMQDTLQNLVAGIILQARRPFRRGDQVQIDKFEGIIDDVDLRNVSLVTFDGLNVFVPNKTVLENPIVNYTRTPTRRTQLKVGVAYGTDLARAQRVLLEATGCTPGIEQTPTPAAWVQEFADSAINFVVLFWHAVDRASVWQARSDVATSIKAALDSAQIEVPFPQRSVWIQSDARAADSSDSDRGNGGSDGGNGSDESRKAIRV
jgi:small-conductance mechanosensitive channel